MPRANNKKTSPDAARDDSMEPTRPSLSGPGAGPQVVPPAPGFATALEEAWHGWLKPVGGIVLVLVGYMLYDAGWLPDSRIGGVLVAAIIMGAIYGGIEPLLSRYPDRRNQILIGALALAWFVIGAAPVFRIVYPGQVLADVELSADKTKSTTEVKLPDGETGPYEVLVSGSIPGTGEAEATYSLEFTGEGGTSAKIDGSIARKYSRVRASRKGNASVSVRHDDNQNLHRLGPVRGNKLSVLAEIDGEKLAAGLQLIVHRAGPNPLFFVGLGILFMILGFVVDYRLIAPKMAKTYLGMWIGFTIAFAADYRFHEDATPANLVRPAVAAVLFALPVGLLPAWLIGTIVNSFKPRPKKLAGTKA